MAPGAGRCQATVLPGCSQHPAPGSGRCLLGCRPPPAGAAGHRGHPDPAAVPGVSVQAAAVPERPVLPALPACLPGRTCSPGPGQPLLSVPRWLRARDVTAGDGMRRVRMCRWPRSRCYNRALARSPWAEQPPAPSQTSSSPASAGADPTLGSPAPSVISHNARSGTRGPQCPPAPASAHAPREICSSAERSVSPGSASGAGRFAHPLTDGTAP